MSSIGHLGDAQHDELYSLDLTANKDISEDGIEVLKLQLPLWTKCLLLKKVAVEHTYEDKYHAINKLDGNMVLNMKLLEKPDNFWDQFASIDRKDVISQRC